MAVEARHLNLLVNQGASSVQQQQQQMRFPTLPPNLVNNNSSSSSSFYHEAVLQPKTSLNYNNIIIPAASRKRCRDSAMYNFTTQQKNTQFTSLIVADDIMPQIQQHQLEIDTLISQHTKKIRLELEERQKQQARLLAATAMGEGVMKKLKERDEQIQRMGKLNLVLQERVKSLFVENQLWRDLAQSNEATANSLRTNLEQVLLHVEERVEDDAESCCGSTEEAQDKESSCYSERRCKRCGERESCVLLLPCRHLCLCNVCGSGSHKLQTCPVCNSTMTATLHVNTSS